MSVLLGVAITGISGGPSSSATSVDSALTVSGDQPAVRGGSWSVAEAPERVVLISDSAIAGIRWFGALGHLRYSTWIDRLDSCRRLLRESCRGREGTRPLTAQREIQRFVSDHGLARDDDLLIIAVGYNDWHGTFRTDVTAVMTQARLAGFRHVAWLTYRENTRYALPDDREFEVADYAAMNRVLRDEAASGRWPELSLIEFDAAMRFRTSWFTADGVHLTAAGAPAVATWLSNEVLFVRHPEFAPDNWLSLDQR
ncbi:MAG: SGNH/GDSL hydrolase family protein [Actinomycetota bacterium]